MGPTSITLRALQPYLLTYRTFGLVPYQLKLDDGKLIVARNQLCGWNRHASILLMLIIVFFSDRISDIPAMSSRNVRLLIIPMNRFAFSLNVLLVTFLCWSYSSKRLCFLVNRMIQLEKDLELFGCHLKVSFMIYTYFSK